MTAHSDRRRRKHRADADVARADGSRSVRERPTRAAACPIRARLPASARHASSRRPFSSAATSASSSRGSTDRPVSPTISGMDDVRDDTTGTPQDMASSSGRPKPS